MTPIGFRDGVPATLLAERADGRLLGTRRPAAPPEVPPLFVSDGSTLEALALPFLWSDRVAAQLVATVVLSTLRRMRRTLLGAIALVLAARSSFAQAPFVAPLEPLASANDVSDDGRRVVGEKVGPHLTYGGYWDDLGPFQQLFGPYPERFTGARVVSGDGTVIAGDSDSTFATDPRFIWRWTAVDGVTMLPGSDVRPSFVIDVSDDGSTIFGSAGGVAARWDDGVLSIPTPNGYPDGIPGYLLTARPDGTLIGALAVGDAGGTDDAAPYATDGVTLQMLPIPDGIGVLRATRATSDGAVVIGYYSFYTGGFGFYFGFRWTDRPNVQFATLTDLGIDAIPYAVSADGDVIVGSAKTLLPTPPLAAFVWEPSGGLRLVEDVLVEAGVDTTGVALGSANGISADGRTVVGDAFVARIPAPGTVPEPFRSANALVAAAALFGWWRACSQRSVSPDSAAGTS